MKKFYKRPVVEITVFDVEDIITTSTATGGDTYADEAAATALLNAIKSETPSAENGNRNFAGVGNYNSYKW